MENQTRCANSTTHLLRWIKKQNLVIQSSLLMNTEHCVMRKRISAVRAKMLRLRRPYLKESYHRRCGAPDSGGLADFPGARLQCLSRSHFNGYGKTRSHHFLMDYRGFNFFVNQDHDQHFNSTATAGAPTPIIGRRGRPKRPTGRVKDRWK